MKNITNWLFILIVLTHTQNLHGRGLLEVSGWVQKENKAIRNARVQLFNGAELVSETTSNRWGQFYFELNLKDEYLIVVSQDDLSCKSIWFEGNESILNATDSENEMYFEFVLEMDDSKADESHNQFLVRYDHSQQEFVYMETLFGENLLEVLENSNFNFTNSDFVDNIK